MPTSTIQQIPSYDQTMNQNYIAILEKTNQQLSLWSNPYGIMVGVLALMFTLMAIGVSIYLWWSSSEQRKERKKQEAAFFSNLEKIANKNVEEARKNVEEGRKQYDELIAAQEKILKSSTANKEEYEKALIELKRERANIGTNIASTLGNTTVWGTTGPFNITSSGNIGTATRPLYTTAGYDSGTITTATGPLGYGSGSNTIYTTSGGTASILKFCSNSNCKASYNHGEKFCAVCGTRL